VAWSELISPQRSPRARKKHSESTELQNQANVLRENPLAQVSVMKLEFALN